LGAPQPAGSGIYIIPGDFALYRLADTSAPVEPQSTLPVAVGGTATISHSFLWSFDDISGPGGITYTIVTAPAHGSILLDGLATGTFTQADIDDGLVQFRENGEAKSGDSFTFKVSDEAGNTTGPEPFRIAILDHTGPVVISNDTLSVSSGSNVTSLNPFLLDTVALGNTPEQIAYTLLLPPAHGLILDNGAPATSFTQADIDSHLVHYVASGDGAGSDAFVFQVSDAAGTHTGPQLFAIQIEGSSDLVLSSGGSGADIPARGNGAPSADQSFTFDDVSTPAGTAEIRAPAASDIIDPAGGSAMNAGTSTSDPMAYWLLTYSTYSSSSGDCQG
jgi:hypothetical protein